MQSQNTFRKLSNCVLAIAITGLAACSSPPPKGTPTTERNEITKDSVTEDTAKVGEIKQQMCFLAATGKQGKDTLAVTMDVDGSKVSGEMRSSIFEKDARKGTLKGERRDRNINVVWTFMQEGMTDTLNLQFQLGDGELLQRPLVLNAKTGREQTDLKSNNWVKIPKVDCPVVKP